LPTTTLVAFLSAASQTADAEDVKPQAGSDGMTTTDPVPSTIRYAVLFESGSAAIKLEIQPRPNPDWTLRQALIDLNGHPPVHVSAIGYADRVGSDAANKQLSLKRAAAVRSALIEAGVSGSVISIEGRGESDQAVPTLDGAPESANRRVELIIDFYPPDQ
jgi:outer membrane protein OmpA-like peptidoglycan-associated protein